MGNHKNFIFALSRWDICRMIWFLVVIESCEDVLKNWYNELAISASDSRWDPNDSNFFENSCNNSGTSNWQSTEQSCAPERAGAA